MHTNLIIFPTKIIFKKQNIILSADSKHRGNDMKGSKSTEVSP